MPAAEATPDPLISCARLRIQPLSWHCRDAAHPIVPQQELLFWILNTVVKCYAICDLIVWHMALFYSLKKVLWQQTLSCSERWKKKKKKKFKLWPYLDYMTDLKLTSPSDFLFFYTFPHLSPHSRSFVLSLVPLFQVNNICRSSHPWKILLTWSYWPF